jgi:hypothetical protein
MSLFTIKLLSISHHIAAGTCTAILISSIHVGIVSLPAITMVCIIGSDFLVS